MCGAKPSLLLMPLRRAQEHFHPTVPNLIPQFHNSLFHFTGAFNSIVSAVTLFYNNTSNFLDLIQLKQQKKEIRRIRFLLQSTNSLWGP